MRKSSPRVTESEPKGTKSEPKGTKSEQKGSQGEPKVSHWEPKVSQREPKVSQIQHKINIKDRVAKRSRNSEAQGGPRDLFLGGFWSHFSLKVDEKIRRRKSHGNRWKIDAKTMCNFETFRNSVL